MAKIIKFGENKLATGIVSPRYVAQKVAQNNDPDLFIDMLASHPEHIERSKEKRNRILADRIIREQMELEKKEEREALIFKMALGIYACVGIIFTMAFLML